MDLKADSPEAACRRYLEASECDALAASPASTAELPEDLCVPAPGIRLGDDQAAPEAAGAYSGFKPGGMCMHSFVGAQHLGCSAALPASPMPACPHLPSFPALATLAHIRRIPAAAQAL